jgi:RHS repeat-associated protein
MIFQTSALRPALLAALTLAFGASSTWAQTSSSPTSTTATITRVSSFEYNAAGLLVRETVEPERPNDCLSTTYIYDSTGNKTSMSTAACTGATGDAVSSASTPRTASTQFAAQSQAIGSVTYSSPAGLFATSSANALGQTERKEYDPRTGALRKLTGPNGLVTTWTHDSLGRKTEERRADGTTTRWEYRLCGQAQGDGSAAPCAQGASIGEHPLSWYVVKASYSSAGVLMAPKKLQVHDILQRLVRVQTEDFSGQTVVQDTRFNALGQVAQRSNLYRLNGGTAQWTNYSYDALGRVTQEDAPDGNGGRAITRWTYNGLETVVTNAANQTQTTLKNATGQTAKVTDHLGNQVQYAYNPLGQLIQTNAAGSFTRMGYTQRGHKAWMEDPAMGRWDYAYNVHGELVRQTDSLGQTSTMTYDLLGRMTQRSEPDLLSNWFYDKKADGTTCGKGVGKLCEARSDNGYRRLHTYDSLGRPSSTSTTMDSTTTLATVTLNYEASTGRLATQTWPTGYKAAYQYNTRGFLSQVRGGGVTGHAQTVTFEVLAMNPQGQITQYRYGNQVTTVKNIDEATGKLNRVLATLTGQKEGNVLDHRYGYDALGNLKTRVDANTGVSESFQYDALNRLSLYTALGGGLSGTQAVQTLYDAAGNLRYKSDVGYYHYDAARPNRLTNITLSSGGSWSAIGAVTQANTGTRALSYALDDERATARSVNGTPLGNGNLWYTVTQDQVTGLHNARWETYTSFNMPSQILLADLSTSHTDSPAQTTGYTCPAGFTLSGTTCSKSTVNTSAATPVYSCPVGHTLSGTTCTSSVEVSKVPVCPAQFDGLTTWTQSNSLNSLFPKPGSIIWCKASLPPSGNALSTSLKLQAMGFEGYPRLANSWYPAGWTDPNQLYCVFFSCQVKAKIECPSNAVNVGDKCIRSVSQVASVSGYVCPAGAALSGSTCQSTSTQTQSANPVYSCPAGATLSGSVCQTPNPTLSVAERTLTFAYGPEHQRTRQSVQLASNAPSHMEAGTNWYLNGQDNLGLTYEKEVKANGTTEHKHFLNAGGITFALYTQRTGVLNGKPATSTSYFHHDHLGSIAVVSNQAGAVVEQMAYDPWGKRRFPNGTNDKLDALYGVSTDRGYTMHEHLDEMGVIHMNGRVYDPLIGRFMSADPFIQAPQNLQSYNRYAYVLNNPLAHTDPSGYFSLKKLLRGVLAITVGYLTAGAVQPWALLNGFDVMAAKILAGAAGGFASGAIAGGDIKSAVHGGLTGGLFGAAGLVGGPNGADTMGRYVAHAAAGCVSAVAGGAQCSAGATSAVFGKYTTNAINGADWLQGDIAKGVATSFAGGVGSVIAGGKFANGAETAAFGYLFNHLMSLGANIRVPLVGGAKFAVGVSYENGKWDAGVIIDSDVPSLSAGKYVAKTTVDISYQTGDFESNHSALSQTLQVGAKGVGISIQRGTDGVNGAGISLGPQLGVQASAQQTRTVSVRSDVVPAVNKAIDRIKGWLGN